jgi:hypothetical protein
MAVVSEQERQAMIRLKSIMEGKPIPYVLTENQNNENRTYVMPPGPPILGGAASPEDVNAMADVLTRLNSLSTGVVDTMLTESATMPEVQEALQIERNVDGVKVGRYQILVKEDQARLAGKQFYSIYNSLTNDTIADDISLYETAISVVRLLNSGKFANSSEVRKLFETDESYSSHRVDAIMFKRRLKTTKEISKRDIYESRYQASLDRMMSAKKQLKGLINGH